MDRTGSSRGHWNEREFQMAQAAEQALTVPVFTAVRGEIGWNWHLRWWEEDEVSSDGSGSKLLEELGEDEVLAAYEEAQTQMGDLLWSLVKGSAEGAGRPDELFKGQQILQRRYLELRRCLWMLEAVFGKAKVVILRRKMVREVDPLVNQWYWHYKMKLEETLASGREECASPPRREQVLGTTEARSTSPPPGGQSIGRPRELVALDDGETRPDGSSTESRESTLMEGGSSTDKSSAQTGGETPVGGSTRDHVPLSTGRVRKKTHNESPCACCRGRHALWQCHRFQGLSSSGRRTLVRKVEACFVCLRSNHETSDCPQNPWNRCEILGCYGGHH